MKGGAENRYLAGQLSRHRVKKYKPLKTIEIIIFAIAYSGIYAQKTLHT